MSPITPIQMWITFALAVIGVAGIRILTIYNNRKLRKRLRDSWGKPRERYRDMTAIEAYHHRMKRDADGESTLDERTWTDLHLDSVFAWLDRTESALGQQALYHRLRTESATSNAQFEQATTVLTDNAAIREQVQLPLNRIRSSAGWDLWRLTQPGLVKIKWWHAIFPVLTAVVVVSLVMIPFWPRAALIVLAVVVLNIISRSTVAMSLTLAVTPFRQLAPMLTAAEELGRIRAHGLDETAAIINSELPHLRKLRRVAGWAGRDQLAMPEVIAALYEYLNIFFLVDTNAMYFAARELGLQGPSLRAVLVAVGNFDAALAVASVRSGSATWCRPEAVRHAGRTELSAIYHPLVDNAVANHVSLDELRGLIVTGSNMSGKSTLLRTVGVNAVLARTINTCFASKYVAPMFAVRSCIGRSDDMMAGKSYYLVEVESVLELVKLAERDTPYLFLFDELFRGTNTIERIAAGEAVLRTLLEHGKAHLVVAATHDIELVDYLRDRYRPVHFDERVTETGLSFDFGLKPGPAVTRNAIALLQLHGAPHGLIESATDRARELDGLRATASRPTEGA